MTHAILQTIHSETQDKIVIIIMRRFNYLVRHSNKNVILTGDTEGTDSAQMRAEEIQCQLLGNDGKQESE